MVLISVIRNTATKRFPLIKFRKGGVTQIVQNNVTPQQQQQHQQQTRSASGNAIEDWELPARYRRRPIDEKECAYINRGGAE